MMTKDEIMNMCAGPKMDKLVAEKVTGWNFPNKVDSLGRRVIRYKDLPRYSTDIAAAWKVIATFNRSEWDIEIGSDTEDDGKFWGVSLIKWSEEPIGPIAYGGGEHESLPLAICRAALLAVMEVD